jgi:S-DNA-T family DNA segregation ATPase FtsK/SpoIIIE
MPPASRKQPLVIPKTKEEIAREAAAAKIIDPSTLESAKSVPKTASTEEPASPGAKAASGSLGRLNIVKPEETRKARSTLLSRADENYQFPPLSLLREPVKIDVSSSEEEHRQNAENLLRILAEFGVEVTLGEIHVGPVITRYEVIPAAGVRVEKIAGLDKNIALGMRAQSVRIMAPIPGKAAVGVEVPNQKRMEVGLREILESEDWAAAKAELPIALGKDVSGRPLVSDLAKMPHLLIAGATGSGKSVCINAIIASILYHASPRDVRLLMIDPKIVELKIFNVLPHMLIPVVTEAKKVPAALKWLLKEMEMRYQIFAKVGVRNISGFNSRKKSAKEAAPASETQATIDVASLPSDVEVPEHMYYVVAIIDELADLMMAAPAEIENSVARLAQLARATGIHIIIATQRPSVNVITGIIKANLPSRIAFQVASQVDSRTIIDTKGAETLIGRGDMLFSPPGTSRLVRAQGALVADEEISKILEFLQRNGPPAYAQDVQAHIDRAASEDEEELDDDGADDELGDDEELFKQAVEVLKASRRASTSMLQRRLRIGYNRAARVMELMEEKGIVGPENGAQPREILVDLEKL